jgi:hypothetical protein
MLINPRTYDGVLSLLYYAQDSAIQININNKSIPHAYNDQAQTCEEFNKIWNNQVKHQNMNRNNGENRNLKDTWLGLQSSPN